MRERFCDIKIEPAVYGGTPPTFNEIKELIMKKTNECLGLPPKATVVPSSDFPWNGWVIHENGLEEFKTGLWADWLETASTLLFDVYVQLHSYYNDIFMNILESERKQWRQLFDELAEWNSDLADEKIRIYNEWERLMEEEE